MRVCRLPALMRRGLSKSRDLARAYLAWLPEQPPENYLRAREVMFVLLVRSSDVYRGS